MIIVVRSDITENQITTITSKIEELGLQAINLRGLEKVVINVVGDSRNVPDSLFSNLPYVEQIIHLLKPYKLVSREFKPDNTVVDVKGIPIGGKAIQIIAGPCSVEMPEQMDAAARATVAAGALLMRGGAYKPRTSPYTFQGHGEKGLEYLVEAARQYNLPVVTELMDARDLDNFLNYGVDVIQIGTRNMQNFPLLKEVGRLDIPVILKRGMAATINDWLMAAEYIAAEGNMNIILAERGIRTFERAYRNVLDVSSIPFLKRETHLPVIVDPSHAGGQSWMVPALSRAAIAAGADGLLIECHPNPDQAWSDGEQALTPENLKLLLAELRSLAQVFGRDLGQLPMVQADQVGDSTNPNIAPSALVA
jgi:3-deoxy-7-phosphoheptulonate synthase